MLMPITLIILACINQRLKFHQFKTYFKHFRKFHRLVGRHTLGLVGVLFYRLEKHGMAYENGSAVRIKEWHMVVEKSAISLVHPPTLFAEIGQR